MKPTLAIGLTGLLLLFGCGYRERVPAEKTRVSVGWARECVEVADVSFELCRIPVGSLRPGGSFGGSPNRRFEIGEFWLASNQVTNADYELFDPGHRRDDLSAADDSPVTGVSWFDARSYVAWLSDELGMAARLPTSLEWEYACLGGSSGPFPWGQFEGRTKEDQRELANIRNSRSEPVGGYPANAFGLFDVVGNAVEWCSDWWVHDESEQPLFAGDPGYEEADKELKVLKNCPPNSSSFIFCQCYYSSGGRPGSSYPDTGFRVASSERPPRPR